MTTDISGGTTSPCLLQLAQQIPLNIRQWFLPTSNTVTTGSWITMVISCISDWQNCRDTLTLAEIIPGIFVTILIVVLTLTKWRFDIFVEKPLVWLAMLDNYSDRSNPAVTLPGTGPYLIQTSLTRYLSPESIKRLSGRLNSWIFLTDTNGSPHMIQLRCGAHLLILLGLDEKKLERFLNIPTQNVELMV